MIIEFAFSIITRGKDDLFKRGYLSKVVSKILSTSPFGRIVFQLLLFVKYFSLRMPWSQNAVRSMGGWFDRAIEYSWVLKQLNKVKP